MTPVWIRGAMLQALAVALLCALILAPVVLSVTHGPGAVASAMQAEAAKVAHGHSHDWDGPGKSGQHDATDHEHNFAVVLPSWGNEVFGLSSVAKADGPRWHAELSRDGPRRPPRSSIA